MVAPHDDHGRWFCIVYALIGIPVMTTHLAVINLFFMQGINKLDKLFKRLYKFCSFDKGNKNSRIFIKIAMVSIAFILFLLLHFTIFFAIQHARDPDSVTSFMNSTYFAVITYGTIGFGDVTPQSMDFTQAMEVVRVLMFASTGLALVGLCFTLYREAADTNMKVISKKMSVLPSRISSVQIAFIDSLQRSRTTRAAAAAASDGAGGADLGSKKVWGRVGLQKVLESAGAETIQEEAGSVPAVRTNGTASLWSRVNLRDVIERGGISRKGSSSRSSTVSQGLQNILESLSRRASKGNDKKSSTSSASNNCSNGTDEDTSKAESRGGSREPSACSKSTPESKADIRDIEYPTTDPIISNVPGGNDCTDTLPVTISCSSLNSGADDQNISTLIQIESEISQAIAHIQTDEPQLDKTDKALSESISETSSLKKSKGCSAGR